VSQENSVDLSIERCLEALGISHISEWDVLAFLNRHGTSLASADHISRLLGYGEVAIANALNKLESSGLVQRSRASHGVRYYALAVNLDPSRKRGVQQLMDLAEKRTARLVLAKRLRQRSDNQPRERARPLHPDRKEAKHD
jgi:DNA-binding MarR family transcriptional regulator